MVLSDDRRQPLLGGAPPKAVAAPSRSLLAAPVLALAYLLATTVDRVAFARMTAHMPHEVLLMHAALAALHTALFMVLRLARSQSSRSAVSEKLQRLRPLELLAMATLDALQSLLALDGATQILGTMQVLLVQGIVPATVLLSPLLPADPRLRPQTYSRLQLVAAVALAEPDGAAEHVDVLGRGGLHLEPDKLLVGHLDPQPGCVGRAVGVAPGWG